MVGIIEHIKLCILSVDCQCILCQIVGSDTEEVYHLCKSVTDDCCCRSFDHDSLLRNLCIKFCTDLRHDLLDLLYLPDGNNHRHHNGNVAERTRTVQRTKLCLKNLRAVQADAHCAVAERRVILFVQIKVVNLLIRTDIQRTDDNFSAAHHLRYALVCGKLFLLRRIMVILQI